MNGKIRILLDNGEQPLFEDTGRQAAGQICLANEERFTSVNFSEALTTYAVGWRDPANIEATLDAMFPAVQVSRRFEYKSATNSKEFLSEGDDVRAIGSPFKRVEYPSSSVNQSTQNKGLTIRLDNDERTEGDEEAATRRLINRLNRNDLRRGVALLIAAATNSNKTWDSSADPDMDVSDDLITSGDARGIDANTVVYGSAAWQLRHKAFRAQDNAGGYASAVMTPDQLRSLLGVDNILISKERYQSSSTAKSKIVGSYVLMYFADMLAAKDDPSNAKRFWTPTESGRYRVYVDVRAKWTDITVEHYSRLVITSTLGIRMFTVS